MARTKQFDPAKALDAAMHVFWAKGYEASSIQDLLDAMKLNRASLYENFGGKRQLFLAALDRYIDNVNRGNLAHLDGDGSVVAALHVYFENLIDLAVNEGAKLGCLLANTAVELAPHDREIEQKITAVFARAEARFGSLIERGQSQGEIDRSLDAAAIAGVLMTVVLGIRVRTRCDPLAIDLRTHVATTLKTLGLGHDQHH